MKIHEALNLFENKKKTEKLLRCSAYVLDVVNVKSKKVRVYSICSSE